MKFRNILTFLNSPKRKWGKWTHVRYVEKFGSGCATYEIMKRTCANSGMNDYQMVKVGDQSHDLAAKMNEVDKDGGIGKRTFHITVCRNRADLMSMHTFDVTIFSGDYPTIKQCLDWSDEWTDNAKPEDKRTVVSITEISQKDYKQFTSEGGTKQVQ